MMDAEEVSETTFSQGRRQENSSQQSDSCLKYPAQMKYKGKNITYGSVIVVQAALNSIQT
jgi:hypothetical protein